MFNPTGWLSKLLMKCGIPDYIRRVEFSSHIAWGLVFGAAGFYWHWGFWVFWTAFVLWDEFKCDGHWKVFVGKDDHCQDLCYDLGSKMFGLTLYGIIGFVRALRMD